MLGEGGGRGWPCRDKAESWLGEPPWASGRARSPGAAASEHTWGDKRRGGHNSTRETLLGPGLGRGREEGRRRRRRAKAGPRAMVRVGTPLSITEGHCCCGKQGGTVPPGQGRGGGRRQCPAGCARHREGGDQAGSAMGRTEEEEGVQAGVTASRGERQTQGTKQSPRAHTSLQGGRARPSTPQPGQGQAAAREAPAGAPAHLQGRQGDRSRQSWGMPAHRHPTLPAARAGNCPSSRDPTKGPSSSHNPQLWQPPHPGVPPAAHPPE